MKRVSDVLRDITEADEPAISPQARHAILGHPYRPWCSCGDCMRTYLRSVEGKGETA